MEVSPVDHGCDLEALLHQMTAPRDLTVVVRRPPGDVVNRTRALKTALASLDQVHDAAWGAIAGFKAQATTVAAAFAESHGLGEYPHGAIDPRHRQRGSEDSPNRILRRHRSLQPTRSRVRL